MRWSVLVTFLAGAGLAPRDTSARESSWMASFPDVARDVRAGRPFVTLVVVPLCSNDQIDCGSGPAGRPGRLDTNLYWGAMFGARRWFDRRTSGWERVEIQDAAASEQKASGLLQRAVYRRQAPGSAWDVKSAEQIVVLEAIHGDRIDSAVDRFWRLAGGGGRVKFADGGRARNERVHVAGYAGHNRLMDGLKLGEAPLDASTRAIPSFVLACYSESYFDESLRSAGSTPLVTTRALMAPEGYAIDAAVKGLGDGGGGRTVRDGVVREYARMQRLSFGVASSMFTKPR